MNETTGVRQQSHSIAMRQESARLSKRRAIMVLGMHRSGTSALAGVLSGLGVAAPKTLMGAGYDNPRGYFESAALGVAYDEMLAAAGSHWSDWRQVNPQWLHSTAAERHRQRIKALIIEEFGDEPLILIKDPRICRFIPFMSSILAELHVSPVAILPVRNPLEVAHSLKRRDEFTVSRSILLWLRHVLEAEFRSRHMPRTFLSYEKLVVDWRHYVDRATEETGVIWPDRSARSDARIDQFLMDDLRHERVSFDEIKEHPEVTPLVRDTYDILTKLVDRGKSKELLDQLDQVRSKFDQDCRVFDEAHDNLNLAILLEQATTEVHRQTVERNALAAAYQSLVAEHDRLAAAHIGLVAEHDRLAVAHIGLVAEHDRLAAAHISQVAEYGRLAAAHISLVAEHDRLAAAHISLVAEHDRLATAHNGLVAEHDNLITANNSLIAERDNLSTAHKEVAGAHDKLIVERDTLVTANNRLVAERDSLAAAHNRMISERDALAADHNKLIVERDAMFASYSWRLTGPLRSLRRLFGR